MKYQTTKRDVLARYGYTIALRYCRLQELFDSGPESPAAYTASRALGWRADIYDMGGGVAVVTGYAPFGNVWPSERLLNHWCKLIAEEEKRNEHDWKRRFAARKRMRRQLAKACIKEHKKGETK